MMVPDWHELAECARHRCNPSLEGTPPKKLQRVARSYCAGCPVMAECAAEALQNTDTGVVRGGMFIPQGNGRYHRPSTVAALRAVVEAGRRVHA